MNFTEIKTDDTNLFKESNHFCETYDLSGGVEILDL